MRRFASERYGIDEVALRVQEGAQARILGGFVVSDVTVRDDLEGSEIHLEAKAVELEEQGIEITVSAIGVEEAEDLLLRILDPAYAGPKPDA